MKLYAISHGVWEDNGPGITEDKLFPTVIEAVKYCFKQQWDMQEDQTWYEAMVDNLDENDLERAQEHPGYLTLTDRFFMDLFYRYFDGRRWYDILEFDYEPETV